MLSLQYYNRIFSNNIRKPGSIFIESKDDIQDLKKKIATFLEDENAFHWVAVQKKFKQPKAGKYILKKGMSNNDIVNLLRSGNQTPVKVAFNNQDTLEKLAHRIATQVETDSTKLMQAFLDPLFLKENNFTEKTVLGIFIPNRYEVYWTISAEKFRNKMLKEYTLFWNTKRVEKAKKTKLIKKRSHYISINCSKRNSSDNRKTHCSRLVFKPTKKRMALASRPYNNLLYSSEKGDKIR